MSSDDTDYPIEVLREFKRLFDLAQEYMAKGEYQRAIDVFMRSMEMTEPDCVVYNYVALCHMMLNEPDKSIDTLREAIALNPEYDEALQNISVVLTDRGDLEEAEHFARRSVGVSSTLSDAWWSLGRVLHLRGKYREAMEALATAIGLEPDNADAHHLLGLTLELLDEHEKAERSLYRAAELEPDNAEILADYGRFLTRHEMPEDAAKVLRRATEADPFDYTVLTSMAEAMIIILREKDTPNREDLADEVLTTLNRSLELNPVYGKTWFHWGEMTLFYRDWEKGERLFRHAIDCGYEGPMAWAWLSAVVGSQGRDEEASEIFEEFKRRRDALEQGESA